MKTYLPVNSISIIEENGLYGFVEYLTGKIIVEPIYKATSAWGPDDKATVRTVDDKWFTIDRSNTITQKEVAVKKLPEMKTDKKWKIGSIVLLYYKNEETKVKINKINPKTVTVITETGNSFWKRFEDILDVIQE